MMTMDLISSGERDQSSWVSKAMELWERKSWGEIFLTLKQIDSIFWNTVEYKKSGDWTNSDNYFNVLRLQNIIKWIGGRAKDVLPIRGSFLPWGFRGRHVPQVVQVQVQFISTEGAPRIPTIYDNHYNPIPSIPTYSIEYVPYLTNMT